MRTKTRRSDPRTGKARIRRLLAQYDDLAGAYANALIRGQVGWARRREANLKRLGRQIRDQAREHGLVEWTRTRLTGN